MAAIPPPASLLGDSDVPPPPSEIQEPSSDEWSKMSAREKKLFQLRLKANSARKINHKQVVEEDRRAQEGPNFEKMRLKQQREEEKEKKRKELEEAGLDPEKEEILTATATDAEWLDKKRKNGQKDKGSFGWDQFNVEAQFNAHKKRMKMAEKKFSKEEYEKQKALQGEDFFRGAHFIGYGSSSNVSEEGVERMVKELDESIKKRKDFSRRRPHVADQYVDYINERNKVFNRKISRAFDEYTVEIRQNLERGTAL